MSRAKQEFIELGLMILLSSLASGAAFSIYDLSEFSPLPGFLSFLVPLIAGASIGALTRSLGQALLVVLLVSLLGIGVIVYALSYPELRSDHLGLEIVASISLRNAIISGFFYILPLTLIGVLIGKLMFRE